MRPGYDGPQPSSEPSSEPSWSSRLSTFPVDVRGSSSTNSTSRGTLYPARFDLTYFFTSSSVRSLPSRVTTTAFRRWPNSSSSTPNTAASATASWPASRSSTSPGKTFSPPETIMSSSRPSMNRRPPSSKWPTSPDESRPSIASLLPPPVYPSNASSL